MQSSPLGGKNALGETVSPKPGSALRFKNPKERQNASEAPVSPPVRLGLDAVEILHDRNADEKKPDH